MKDGSREIGDGKWAEEQEASVGKTESLRVELEGLRVQMRTLQDTATRRFNGPKLAGEMPPEYWQTEQRKALAEVLTTAIVPLFTNLAAILNEIRIGNAGINQQIAVMLERLAQTNVRQ